jgi:hypothetical protein
MDESSNLYFNKTRTLGSCCVDHVYPFQTFTQRRLPERLLSTPRTPRAAQRGQQSYHIWAPRPPSFPALATRLTSACQPAMYGHFYFQSVQLLRYLGLVCSRHGHRGVWGSIYYPQGPPYFRPKLARGVWQFHVIKIFREKIVDLFFWGCIYFPPTGDRYSPPRRKTCPCLVS